MRDGTNVLYSSQYCYIALVTDKEDYFCLNSSSSSHCDTSWCLSVRLSQLQDCILGLFADGILPTVSKERYIPGSTSQFSSIHSLTMMQLKKLLIYFNIVSVCLLITVPHLHLAPLLWPRMNLFEFRRDLRKLESLGYRAALFAWSYIKVRLHQAQLTVQSVD